MLAKIAAWTLVIVGAASTFAEAATSTSVQANEYSYGYLINRAHTGNIAFSSGFQTPLKRIWKRDLGRYVSYPIIARGLVFVTIGDTEIDGYSYLVALKLSTGRILWERTIETGLDGCCITAVAHAAYDDGKIFVTDEGSPIVRAFSANRAGTLLWEAPGISEIQYSAPPTAYRGTLFGVGAGAGEGLFAFSEADGSERWVEPVNGDESAPAIGDGRLYVSFPCQAYGFNPENGTQLWHYMDGCFGGGGTTPVFGYGRLYPADPFSNYAVLSASDGSTVGHLRSDVPPALWTDSNGKHFELAVQSGTLISVPRDSTNYAWSFGQNLVSSPIVVNDTVAVASYDSTTEKGRLFIVDASNGKKLWSTRLSPPFYQCYCAPYAALGAGLGTLIVPQSKSISAYVPASTGNVR